MASGLNGQSFAFSGYLPVKPDERTAKLRELEKLSAQKHQTQMFIETPYRNIRLMEDILKVCMPSTRLCIAADLTLETEYIRTMEIRQWKNVPMPGLSKRPAVFLILA